MTDEIGKDLAEMLGEAPTDTSNASKEEGEELEDKKDEASGKEKEALQEEDDAGAEDKGEDEEGEEGETKAGEDDEAKSGAESDESDESGEDTELEALRKQNELLQEQLSNVLEPKKPAETEEPKEEEPSLDVSDYIDSDEVYDAVLQDKAALNKVLNKVAEHAYLKAVEHVTKSMPRLITKVAKDEVSSQIMANEFFRAHPELTKQRKFVGFVYNEMLEKNPDKDPITILTNELAGEVRSRLGIAGKTQPTKKKKARPPFTPGGGGRRGGQAPKKPTGIGADIAEMEKLR